MKKTRLLVLFAVLAVALLALAACTPCTKHQDINNDGKCDVCFAAIVEEPDGNGGDDGGDEGGSDSGDLSFGIKASSTAVYSGSTVTLSLKEGAILGSYTEASVVYSAETSGDSLSATFDGASLAVYGTGTVTVKASVGDSYSSNTVKITVLPGVSTVSELIASAVSAENAYLGVRHDIGLTEDTVGYYNIVGEEDYVRLNDDGTLEIIGARAKNSILKVTALDGDVVYENFYTVTGSRLVAAIRESLLAEGKILSASADIPASKIAEVESLSLSESPLINAKEFSGFKFLTNLKSLNLRNNSLGDLSYLKGMTALTDLDIGYAGSLELSDNGIAVCNNLRSLTALDKLSIKGSLSQLNRQVYDTIHTMVANGEIELEALTDVWVGAADIDSFSETVFFSIAECKAHAEKHGGAIVPAGEWKHAIISIPAVDYDKYFKVYADNLSVLELFGSSAGYSNAIQVYSLNSLDVNLYNFALSAPRRDYGIGLHIDNQSTVDTTLRITAKRGYNYLRGADWYPGSFPNPGEAIVCDNLEVYSENGASLNVVGGLGYIGEQGVWNNGPGQGFSGGDGADAIVCNEAWFYTYSIRVQGGNGGAGGKGCNGGGELYESVLGYFNGAKGGTGGTGGYALYCASFHTLDLESGRSFINECLFGGGGGIGGEGGDPKMAGHKGETGDPGSAGRRYLGEAIGRPNGPIHE